MQSIPNRYWAKFKPAGAYSLSEPASLELKHHLLDVAICFERLLDTGYGLTVARVAGLTSLSDQQKHRLCFLAFLHDIGKAAVDFQRQIFHGENHKRRHKGHTALCTFFFTAREDNESVRAFNDWLPEGCDQWFSFPEEDGFETLSRLLLATWGHHGMPIDFDFMSANRAYADVHWDGWRYTNFPKLLDELKGLAKEIWPKAFDLGHELKATAALMEEFNGLLQLADWIASDISICPYEFDEAHTTRREFTGKAVARFLERTGRNTISIGNSFSDAFGFTPNPMQSTFLTISSDLIQ
jgi:CRISPR-associated endonuclease/helicase Cas3